MSEYRCTVCGWMVPEGETLPDYRPGERFHVFAQRNEVCGPVVEQPATEEVMPSGRALSGQYVEREDGRVKGASQRYVERMFGQRPADDTPDVVADWRKAVAVSGWQPRATAMGKAGDALAERVEELQEAERLLRLVCSNLVGTPREQQSPELADISLAITTWAEDRIAELEAEVRHWQGQTNLADDRWHEATTIADKAERQLEVAKEWFTRVTPNETALAEIDKAGEDAGC